MAGKYAATYRFGKTTVYVVAPPPMTQEQINAVLAELHRANWDIWNSLSTEEQIRINAEAKKDEQRKAV